MSSPGDARADALRDRLAAIGLRVDVRAEGALALLSPAADRDPARWASSEVRDAAVREARACGFTNVALELLPTPHAHVHRAEPAP